MRFYFRNATEGQMPLPQTEGWRQIPAVCLNRFSLKSFSPWLMLFSRPLFFAMFQVLIAGFLAFAGSPSPWHDSASWWTISALFTNLVSMMLLAGLFRQENKRFFDFIPPSRQAMWKDIGIVLILIMAVVPIATFPNHWLANLLFGSNDIVFLLIFRPLPLWAGIVSLLFPITIAFAELPTYFGYIMPRLEKQLGKGWLAWGLASLFLAFQHVTLPLIIDWRFIVWRFGMFIPLAFFMGLCLKLRPYLFPYLMTVHAILDMATVAIILSL